MPVEAADTAPVLNQLKAVSKALDGAGFALIGPELRRHVANGPVSDADLAQLEKFFLSLGQRQVPNEVTDR